MTPSSERRLQRLMDLGERLLCLLLFAGLVARLSHSLALRPANALALLSEGLIVVFIVLRRGAQVVTTRPLDWVVAVLGSTLPLMIDAGGKPLASPALGTTFMLAGLLLSIWAKLNLRRSFGMAAANRGVVRSGPYRAVRHPMYAGYMLGYLGFWVNNASLANACLYLLAAGFQIARIKAEERVLGLDPAYVGLMQRVRYRLAPRIF